MKNIFVVLFIFVFSLTVSAKEYFGLEWKDIAPERYENIKENKFYFTKSARYWSKRKSDFEKRLQVCKNFEDEDSQDNCFEKLFEKENFYTLQYNDESRLRNLKRLLILNMF